MRIFKTRAFVRFARKAGIDSVALLDAAHRAEAGSIDANLGGCVIKQRVARQGQGRSGGYRTLIAFRSQTRAIFLFGFAKNDLDNISGVELVHLRKAAAEMLGWSDDEVARMVEKGNWTEII